MLRDLASTLAQALILGALVWFGLVGLFVL